MKEALGAIIERSGGVAWGVAPAGAVETATLQAYDSWIAHNHHAGMEYMAAYREVRADARLLLEKGAKSIISIAYEYPAASLRNKALPGISGYALAEDYHKAIKKRLRGPLRALMPGEEGVDWRICVDTAPIFERYWAQQAGLGFIADNGALTIPGIGIRIFLAEIVTTLELEPDAPCMAECMHCGKCSRACPGEALHAGSGIDCNSCLSYLTIEHRGAWSDPRHLKAMQTSAGRRTLFGCDRCLECCPHNERSRSAFYILPDIVQLDANRILSLPDDKLTLLLQRSSLKRAKPEGLRRNAANILSVNIGETGIGIE